MIAKIQPAPEGAGCPLPPYVPCSGTGTEHRHHPTVLRPAGNVVAHRDRAFLAVGNRAHALRLDAARGEIVAHGLRAPGTERDVVLARATLIGMAFDGEGVLVVVLQ